MPTIPETQGVTRCESPAPLMEPRTTSRDEMWRSSPTSLKLAKKSDIIYTDVVIIGNGPSGITLSYLLSGHWPYYNGGSLSDKYLQMRLQEDQQKSLVEQDLEYLSNNLEGRSNNPVAVLFDVLTHPDADVGIEETSLLEWKHHPERAIEHVVLGKSGIGGAWQMMDLVQMQTLSLGNWMELPDLSFNEWLLSYKKQKNSEDGDSNLSVSERACMLDVRNYYVAYVKEMQLTQYFHVGSTVTSVERVLDVCHPVDADSGEQDPCTREHHGKFKWEVRGYEHLVSDGDHIETREFCYRAPNVVMATGTFDKPNHMGVPGENFPYILHSLREVERMYELGKLSSKSDPLVIIGAGLSAADAILYTQQHHLPVVHVFRCDIEDPDLIVRKLPPVLYPEYHEVYNMMRDGATPDTQDTYQRYSRHSVTEFKADGKVLIRSSESLFDTIIEASFALVLVGYRPDLSYLPQDGQTFGVRQEGPIDSKHNPVAIDQLTFECQHEPGLYAMGPLVGDNFVRFLRGGALAITSHLWWKRQPKNDEFNDG